MGTRWERLAGNTSKFAIKLAFSDDPDAGERVTPEESLSWGSLQLWIDDSNICAHQAEGDVVESVHWYLLPLLEWFVSNWDPMLHEERLPNRNSGPDAEVALFRTREPPWGLRWDAAQAWDEHWYDWWSRHSLEAARSGGLLPSVCLRRWREFVELSWDNRDTCAAPEGVRFIQPAGAARLPVIDVAAPLFSIVVEAIDQLLTLVPDSQRLRDLQNRAAALNAPKEERLGWLLSLGRDATEMISNYRNLAAKLAPDVREAVFGRPNGERLFAPSFPAALMFGAVAPDLRPADRIALIEHLASAFDPEVRQEIDELSRDVPVDRLAPWSQGRDLAEDVLQDLEVEPDVPEPVDLDGLTERLGVTIQEVELADDSIRAVSIGGDRYRPTVLLNNRHRTNRYPSGRRFSIAHELCHLFFDRGFARELALPSGPWAPRDLERRANAFGAMLLMPPGRIAAALETTEGDRSSAAFIHSISERLGTSFSATVEHMHNLGFFSDEDRDLLRDEAIDQTGRRNR
jgi:Zn-dependent peptidase ImmA (M78 family)